MTEDMSAKKRAADIVGWWLEDEDRFNGLLQNRIEETIRQAEAAAVARERETWQRWLSETMAHVAKQPVEPDTAIVCGGEPSRGDLMTMGFMTCMLHWKAAIRARSEP